MAYTKNSWESGDIITAAKLNHMEDGIAASDLSASVKTALLQIAAKVAYIDDQGQEYYDALEEALYPDKTLTGIGAAYDQSGSVYPSTSLDSLKSDLTVTAYYDDGSTAAVTTYTLSGTLTVGTSTITATYSGFTDMFEVTVSAAPTVSSIAAVYTQSGTVYDTDSLDSLKADLVVTATYSDSSTSTVPSADYTLSGTLTVGTSTITVSYEGKTTTFNVTVSEYVVQPLYSWDFRNNNLTDSISGLVAETNATQGTDGITFNDANQYIALNTSIAMSLLSKRVEIDIHSMSDTAATVAGHGRVFGVTTQSSYATNNNADMWVRRSSGGWYAYTNAWSTEFLSTSDYNGSYFSGKTLVLNYDATGKLTVSVDGNNLITYTSAAFTKTGYFVLGGSNTDQLYRLAPTISAVRIYEGEE